MTLTKIDYIKSLLIVIKYIIFYKGYKMKEKEKRFSLKYILLIIITVVIIVISSLLFIYYHKLMNKENFLNNIQEFAQLGDFLGGTLNPIFAFITILLLLFTIYIQTEELKATREELKESRIAQQEQSESLKLQNQATKLQMFENTFFQLNEVFNNTKNGLSIKVDIYKSNDGFMDGRGGEITECFGIDDADLDILNCMKTSVFISYDVIERYLIIFKIRYKTFGYDEFNKRYEKYTGTYFGQIYQIIKFIDESNIDNKQRYVDIFRAQFTKDELEFLFYHCLGILGKRKFKKLVEDYEFFEHIILNPDIEQQLLEYEIKAFGKNESILNKYNKLESKKS